MAILTFKDVYKTFEDGSETIEALKKTSFEINSGELIAIVGPSGSGKSTLLTIMGGLQSPSGGEITFDGDRLDEMSIEERNRLRFKEIGFILQTSNLIPYLTIEDQFRFVDEFAGRDYRKEHAEKLLDHMGILKRKELYPNDLSGGEKQRAAICRALYMEPHLLLADEPTASLDTEKAMDVVELLAEQTHDSDRSTVMVTHDERLLEFCDRVFRIVDGEVSEES